MKRITKLRKDAQLSQSDLAEKIGVSQQTISKYEQGTREPDISTLLRLSQLFNVSIDYLLENPYRNTSSPTIINDDEKELLSYYSQLNKVDKRWIMGQMIDLIKKSEEQKKKLPKAQ